MNYSLTLPLKRIGISLIFIGLSYLFDVAFFTTGKAGCVTVVIFSFLLCLGSIFWRLKPMVLVGGLTLSLALGMSPLFFYDGVWVDRLRYCAVGIGAGFLMMALGMFLSTRNIEWWAGFIGWALVFSGSQITDRQNTIDQIIIVALGVGSGLLIWGIGYRKIGLIISGSIATSLALGVNYAWIQPVLTAGLTNTGVMLVWFALGWGSIVIISRLVLARNVWWPLIPGGILAVVGWGLYTGGNPNTALNFIGNTGSIAVLIFGLYLLLMRQGMKG